MVKGKSGSRSKGKIRDGRPDCQVAGGQAQPKRRKAYTSAAIPLVDDRQMSQVLTSLRALMRAQGLHNRDIASSLGVTERTVSRWVAGRGLTVQALQQLCALADITLMELFEIAGAKFQKKSVTLSRRQEQELVDNPIMALFFANICHGFPVDELKDQLGLSDADMVLALVGLEKLGLIELLLGNRIRLLVPRDVRWRENGPRNRAATGSFEKIMGKIDFCDPALMSEWSVLRLSRRSTAYLRDKFSILMKEIFHLAELDRRSDSADCEWHAVILAARRISTSPYELWRRVPSPAGPGKK